MSLPVITGPNLRLRPVMAGDAGYIHGLRTDPRYNAHLSSVTGTVEDQRRWIEGYKAREAEGREAYFVIERHDGVSCGTVRLYGIEGERFTWGSWILDARKPQKAALESAVLSFDFGFETRGLAAASIDVRRDNARAIKFYRRFGMTECGSDDLELYFAYSRSQFLTDRPGFMTILASSATT